MSTFEQLKEEFREVIVSSVVSKQMINAMQKQQATLTKEYQKIKGMFEKRQYQNLEIKEQMKINGQRYANSFTILRQSSHFQLFYRNIDFVSEISSFSLSTQAFLPTIELIGTKKQMEYWKEQIFSGKVIGAYGQTQLGHGSNVQGLETQAHYDEKSELFTIKSPKITSYKFWPGVLGTYCTHCVLQAKTFVKGKSIGIQTFVFQMRDKYVEDNVRNLKNLPGVEAGQIGPKLGFHRVDNGYLKINDVSIPRQNMLMKYIKVQKDGTVLGLQNKQSVKYGYGSMLNLRVALTNNFALRYMVRCALELYYLQKRLKIEETTEIKKQVIESICCGYGFCIANIYTMNLFENFKRQLEKEDYNAADNWLVSCHIVSSTIKAISSWKGLEISQKCLTASKYSIFNISNIPNSFVDAAPSTTYEGDNSVLLQQTAKYVLMKDAQEGQIQLIKPSTDLNSADLEASFKVLEYVTSSEVRRLKMLFQKQTEAGVAFNTFWNQKYQKQIIEIAKLWGIKTIINALMITIKTIEKNRQFFEKLVKVFSCVLLNDVPQLPYYGFNVQTNDQWKSFTEIQSKVLLSLVPRFKSSSQVEEQQKNYLFERNILIKSRL